MEHPSSISILDYTYELPQDKIAVYPLKERDEARLLVYKNQQISESRFRQLSDFLEKGSLLVFNNAKVIPARLIFLNSTQKAIEIFCLEPADNKEQALALSSAGRVRWNCMVGNLKQWKEERLYFSKGHIRLSAALSERRANYVVVEFSWEPEQLSFAEVLQAAGQMPIPPYLNRVSDTSDEQRYQTVYAERQGSVAAPTAGLHFTEPVLKQLKEKEIGQMALTLHVGAGTFKPVKSATMQGHDMHAEWIEVSLESIHTLLRHTQPVIAVGTTSLRTLESLYWMGAKALLNPAAELRELETGQWDPYGEHVASPSVQESLHALAGWMQARQLGAVICRTQILIAPPYQLRVASGLITNFHQPQSTLLLLVSAVAGARWREIYDYALSHNFRFLSYGDSSLILK